MRPIQNEVMLITYADSMGRDLKELETALAKHFEGAVTGIHILPFFPSSGDRGFAVIEYDKVEPAFGDWSDINRLAEKYTLAADFMLNHVSIRCREFKDYMEKGDASPYRNMFIHWNEFWPNGEPTEAENDAMYRRKPGGAFLEFTRKDGKKVKLWNTFFSEQVDIDPYAKATQDYFGRNLTMLSRHVPLIRFDAFAYASKRPGTSCFFVEPDIWNVLDIAMQPLQSRRRITPAKQQNRFSPHICGAVGGVLGGQPMRLASLQLPDSLLLKDPAAGDFAQSRSADRAALCPAGRPRDHHILSRRCLTWHRKL